MKKSNNKQTKSFPTLWQAGYTFNSVTRFLTLQKELSQSKSLPERTSLKILLKTFAKR